MSTKKLRVIFFGHDEISIEVLEIIRKSCDLVAVVLPSNRSIKQTRPIENYAKKNNIKRFKPQNPNTAEFVKNMSFLMPDLAIVYNYSHIFTDKIINIFPLGMINIHGALLPQYRGANVLNWVLINGEKCTGVTIHYINAGIDEGDILAREKLSIGPNDDAKSLKAKLAKRSPIMLQKVIKDIISGKAKARKQSAFGRNHYFPRRSPEDGKIDFTRSYTEISNLIKALVLPWPGAFAYHKGRKIIFERTKKGSLPKTFVKPGKIISVSKNSIEISTGKGTIYLTGVRKGRNIVGPRGFKAGEELL